MRKLLPLVLILLSVAPLCAQNLRITEFLATNVNGIVDEDSTPQGWIEIWNPSTTAKASMVGMKLTNGTSTWTFPSVEIMPDERMIVWASGKNRLVVTAPLHTNFTIPTGGGTLQLLRSDNFLLSQIQNYPAQQPDVSYGRDEWDVAVTPTQVGFYAVPTPEDRNDFSGPGVAGKVVFSTTSRTFTGTMQLTLSQATPDPAAEIRYTTNGTVPTVSSTLYAAPINVSATQQIRARVYRAGLLPGETNSHAFLLMDASTSGFNSAMPIMVLTSFGQTISDTIDTAAYLWVWEPAAPDNRARLTNAPDLVSRIVVDKRGSSTIGNPKFNLNMELRNARDDDDRNEELLGMPSHADWVLGAPYHFDRSDLHNPLAYALSNAAGRYASRTKEAEVFIDVSGGALTLTTGQSGDYFGIYNVTEKIRRDNDRVDVVNLRKYDNGLVAKTGGYLWKVDRIDAGDTGFSAGGQTMAYYDPKEIEIKSPQRDPQEQYLTSYINSFNSVLQSGSWNNPVTGYAAWIDVDAAVDHHLLNVWPFNVDGFRLSGYWTKQRGAKMQPLPIWDYDRTLSSTDGRDANPNTWRSQTGDLGTDFFNYTWWNRLFQDINFYQKYIDRWQDLRRGPLAQAKVDAIINDLNAEISAEAVTRDLTRWGQTKRAWTSPFTGTNYPASQAAEVQRLKDYLQQRANFMDSQWVGPVAVSVPEGNVAVGTEVTLTAPANASDATIYYTLDGIDPRPTGGGLPGAGVLTYTTGTPIPITATTRLRARAYKGSWTALTGANNPPLVSKWGGLTNVRYSVDARAFIGNLAVTELNFNPTGPTAAELAINPVFEAKDFEYIELKNIGAQPIDLGNAKFTNGVNFTFSGLNAITVPAGGYFIVASNPAAFAARYGSTLQVVGPWTGDLSNQGERLVIKAFEGTTILDFTYDDAWFPNGDGNGGSFEYIGTEYTNAAYNNQANWRDSAQISGSPGTQGLGPAPAIVINEIMTNSSSPRVDAIEFFNPTSDPVDISGWYLSDVGSAASTDQYKKYRIPNGTPVIPPGGYHVLTEVNFNPNGAWNPTPGVRGPNEFAFDAEHGDDAWLFEGDASGNLTRFVAHADFGPARQDESWGRFPNGTGKFYPMIQQTLLDAGSANTPLPPLGAANSTPRFGPLLITELQHTPLGNNRELEFVEVYNPTAVDQPLAQWRLRGDVDFDFTTQTIPAGGTLVVVAFDPADTAKSDFFRTHYRTPSVVLAGPWAVGTQYDLAGEVVLYRAGTPPPLEPTLFPQTLEDETNYANGGQWPEASAGMSMCRVSPAGLGDLPASWTALIPNPGRPVNSAPDAVVDTLHPQLTGGGIDLDVRANDTDADNDSLTITIVSNPANGTATTNGNVVTYTPAAGYNGNDTFTYTVSDGFGGVTVGTVQLANALPAANPDSLHVTLTNGMAELDVLANDADEDGVEELVIFSVQTPANGTATTDGLVIVYTPGPGFMGTDQFTYTIVDQHGGTSVGQVSLINTPPTAAADSFHLPLTGGEILVDVRANDTDLDGDSLIVSGVGSSAHGATATNGAAALFTPAAGYNGNTTFSYTIADGFGGSANGSVTLSNSPPVAGTDTADSSGEAVTITVLANDADLDGDPLGIVSVTNGSSGTASINGGSVVYAPGGTFLGEDTFIYTIADGFGGVAVGTVNIRATGVAGRTEAATGAPVPGAPGMFFASMQVPAIGDDGLIAWVSNVKGSGVKSKPLLLGGNPATALFGKGDAAPDLGGSIRFSALKTPVCDSAGRVVFSGTLSGPGVSKKNNVALFATEPGGATARIARSGDPALELSGKTLTKFTAMDSSDGETAFVAKTTGGATGVWSWDGTDTHLVLGSGESLTTSLGVKPVKTISLLSAVPGSPGHPRSHRAGELAMRIGFADKTSGIAIAQRDASEWTTSVLASSGDSTSFGGTWKTFGPAALAAPGTVALSAALGGASKTDDSAIVLLSDSDPVLVARENQASPISGTIFKSFSDPVANSDGLIAFAAKISGGGATKVNDDVLVVRDAGGVSSVVVREQAAVPGLTGLFWLKFVSFALPQGESAGPIFLAQVAGSGVTKKNNLGLWAHGSDGSLVLLARTGTSMMVNGSPKTPAKLVLLNALPPVQGSGRSFNDSLRVAFLATFPDGSQVIQIVRVP